MTDLTQQLQDMREEYDGVPLRKSDLNECPLAQFSAWLLDAQQAKVADPNACSLSTVDESGAPMARAVLLKVWRQESFLFTLTTTVVRRNILKLIPWPRCIFLGSPWKGR